MIVDILVIVVTMGGAAIYGVLAINRASRVLLGGKDPGPRVRREVNRRLVYAGAIFQVATAISLWHLDASLAFPHIIVLLGMAAFLALLASSFGIIPEGPRPDPRAGFPKWMRWVLRLPQNRS